jgi:cell division protein ZapB
MLIIRLKTDCSVSFTEELTSMSQNTLQELAKKLDALINYSEQLKQDNELFKQREHQWRLERNRLIEKNNLACNRVEEMIVHLKSLEKSTN